MKATIERTALLKGLGHVQSVVERRHTIPILAHVLIKAEGSSLQLTATDLDIEVQDSVDAIVERAGTFTAPAHLFYDIVRKLSDGAQVRLEVSGDQRLTISANRADFAVPVLAATDYPQINRAETAEYAAHFQVDKAEIARLIDKTRFAVSTEETRYYLNGIFLHCVTEQGVNILRAVATDGHRLALAEMAAPNTALNMPSVILPRKTIAELRRLIDDIDAPLDVAVNPQKVRFTLGPVVLTSKVIDGSFPDYSRVIPRNNQRMLRISTKAFATAVDRVQTIAQEKSRSIKLSIDTDRVIVSVNNPETGAASEDLAADYSAEAFEIGFNAKYLLDVTAQIRGEDCQFEFADSATPTLVRDLSDQNALFVLMPLRV